MTDYRHMPGREILRRLAARITGGRAMTQPTIAGIPVAEIKRAIGDLERSLTDSAADRWEPFLPATMADQSGDDDRVALMARATGYPEPVVRQLYRDMAGFTYWRNNLYQVAVRRLEHPDGPPALIHLSIKRLDQSPIRDWRHLQRIKNEIVGPEHEGVELFPAESRLADSANQYHLWIIDDPASRWPFGFTDRLVLEDDLDGTGAVQRGRSVA